jgi:hypothetical protein
MNIMRNLKVAGLTTVYIFMDKVGFPVIDKYTDAVAYVKKAKEAAAEEVEDGKYYRTHTLEGIQVLGEEDFDTAWDNHPHLRHPIRLGVSDNG